MLDLAKLLDTMAANYAIKEGLCHLPKGKISLFSLLAANYAIKREFCCAIFQNRKSHCLVCWSHVEHSSQVSPQWDADLLILPVLMK